MDVTDKGSILNAVKVIEANDGKLDVLVNKYVVKSSHYGKRMISITEQRWPGGTGISIPQ